MLTTRPLSHNRIALCCDGFIIFIGNGEQIRQLLGVNEL